MTEINTKKVIEPPKARLYIVRIASMQRKAMLF